MQARVKVGEKRVHLFFCESASEGWHFAFANQNGSDDLRICCGRAAGKRGAAKEIAEARWRGFQGEVVFLVTMGAALLVKMLASCLLRSER